MPNAIEAKEAEYQNQQSMWWAMVNPEPWPHVSIDSMVDETAAA